MLAQSKDAHRFSTGSSYYNFGAEIEEQEEDDGEQE